MNNDIQAALQESRRHRKQHVCFRCNALFSDADWEVGNIKLHATDLRATDSGNGPHAWMCADCEIQIVQDWISTARGMGTLNRLLNTNDLPGELDRPIKIENGKEES